MVAGCHGEVRVWKRVNLDRGAHLQDAEDDSVLTEKDMERPMQLIKFESAYPNVPQSWRVRTIAIDGQRIVAGLGDGFFRLVRIDRPGFCQALGQGRCSQLSAMYLDKDRIVSGSLNLTDVQEWTFASLTATSAQSLDQWLKKPERATIAAAVSAVAATASTVTVTFPHLEEESLDEPLTTSSAPCVAKGSAQPTISSKDDDDVGIESDDDSDWVETTV